MVGDVVARIAATAERPLYDAPAPRAAAARCGERLHRRPPRADPRTRVVRGGDRGATLGGRAARLSRRGSAAAGHHGARCAARGALGTRTRGELARVAPSSLRLDGAVERLG